MLCSEAGDLASEVLAEFWDLLLVRQAHHSHGGKVGALCCGCTFSIAVNPYPLDQLAHYCVPTLKSYLRDREYSVPYSVFYKDGRAASKRLATLLGDKVF